VNTVPVALTYKGKTIRVARQQDSVVDPAMRGRGVGKKLVNAGAKDYEMVIAKGTSDVMYVLRKSAGFTDVANSNHLIQVISPFPKGESIRKKAGFLVLYGLCFLKRRSHIKTGLTAKQVTEFNKDFDVLGKNLSNNDEIRLRKDHSYLNWRYFQCPERSYVVFRVEDENKLRGAVVLKASRSPGETAWIVDMICDSKDETCINECLNAVFKQAIISRAADIRVFSTSNYIRPVLFKRGFIETNRTPRFTYRIEKEDLGFEPEKAEWNFWHGDGDVELYD
jgi:hypothetical protein